MKPFTIQFHWTSTLFYSSITASEPLEKSLTSSVQFQLQSTAFASTHMTTSHRKASPLATKCFARHAPNILRSSYYRKSCRRDLTQAGRTTLNRQRTSSITPTMKMSAKQKGRQSRIECSRTAGKDGNSLKAELKVNVESLRREIDDLLISLIPTTAGIRIFLCNRNRLCISFSTKITLSSRIIDLSVRNFIMNFTK